MNIRQLSIFLIGLMLVVPVSSTVPNKNISIVVHRSNQNAIDHDLVKKLFLGYTSQFSDGTNAQPVNLKFGDPLRLKFEKSILEKNPSQIKAYWSRQVFTGMGKPLKEVSSARDCINLIEDDMSVICYVSADIVTSSVKVVLTF